MIILIVALIAIVSLFVAKIIDEKTYLNCIPFILYLTGIIACVVFVVMLAASVAIKIETPSFEAGNKQRYESLVYQAENNLYENDNDIGKKELVNQIQKWNEDLAKGKIMQDNIWVGCFYSHCYDKFDFIPLDTIR